MPTSPQPSSTDGRLSPTKEAIFLFSYPPPTMYYLHPGPLISILQFTSSMRQISWYALAALFGPGSIATHAGACGSQWKYRGGRGGLTLNAAICDMDSRFFV